jgi:hypothetical protein
MSVDALFNTTMALKSRLVTALGTPPVGVYIGPPVANEVGDAAVSLTLFDVHPSAALRNTPRYTPPPSRGPVTGPATPIESIALELRYLIVCYRKMGLGPDAATFPTELAALGRIVAALHVDPVLSVAAEPDPNADPAEQDAALAEQIVRLSLESYGLDDWNRLWGLFPDAPLRTSTVYVAAPVYVSAGDSRLYPRVQSRRMEGGVSADPQAFAEGGAA